MNVRKCCSRPPQLHRIHAPGGSERFYYYICPICRRRSLMCKTKDEARRSWEEKSGARQTKTGTG